jgi:4a-hydroxytetrahydrobiopterin dehydratase
MPALTTKQAGLRLKTIPDWSQRAQTIFRTCKFRGFLESIDFVNRIAGKAQKANHHPDINIRFNRVTLKLTTHDKGESPTKISPWRGSATRSSPSFSRRDQGRFQAETMKSFPIIVGEGAVAGCDGARI